MIVFKPVRPGKMRNDVFRLEALSAMHKTERDVKKEFQATVKDWNEKPVFESILSTRGGDLELFVGTDDPIYKLVDKGAKPHAIKPKNAKYLGYQRYYQSKTVVGSMQSRPGGKFGPYVRRSAVQHPGFEGREFDQTIRDKYQSIFKARIERAMKIAAEKSGHRI